MEEKDTAKEETKEESKRSEGRRRIKMKDAVKEV